MGMKPAFTVQTNFELLYINKCPVLVVITKVDEGYFGLGRSVSGLSGLLKIWIASGSY